MSWEVLKNFLLSFFSKIRPLNIKLLTLLAYFLQIICNLVAEVLDFNPVNLSLRFNGHFPGETGLAGVY